MPYLTEKVNDSAETEYYHAPSSPTYCNYSRPLPPSCHSIRTLLPSLMDTFYSICSQRRSCLITVQTDLDPLAARKCIKGQPHISFCISGTQCFTWPVINYFEIRETPMFMLWKVPELLNLTFRNYSCATCVLRKMGVFHATRINMWFSICQPKIIFNRSRCKKLDDLARIMHYRCKLRMSQSWYKWKYIPRKKIFRQIYNPYGYKLKFLPSLGAFEIRRYPKNSPFRLPYHKVFDRFHKEDPLSVCPSGIKPLGESKPSGKIKGESENTLSSQLFPWKRLNLITAL